ncbi:hypothetical protein [Gloeobacter kilaueensis]|uniref:Uncharacterized protein n=1 Tax=Gloeobacter kilaueensis (strain ATCC BAA-2537 / CCAP 1431/1 / ULC 316 / JS1) TaxID=1183438 RepID=U5QK39_GLOK1|nr:hypothetical protein [Gloeobacter kilaueensis]AGY57979.1 hypothetical protein GKIL_1733 [Gloeobacter kilaueensis JS1]
MSMELALQLVLLVLFVGLPFGSLLASLFLPASNFAVLSLDSLERERLLADNREDHILSRSTALPQQKPPVPFLNVSGPEDPSVIYWNRSAPAIGACWPFFSDEIFCGLLDEEDCRQPTPVPVIRRLALWLEAAVGEVRVLLARLECVWTYRACCLHYPVTARVAIRESLCFNLH